MQKNMYVQLNFDQISNYLRIIQKLYTDIREIAEKYTKQLGDRSISRALNPTNVSQYPVLDNHPLLQMSASTAMPSPSYTPTSPPQLTGKFFTGEFLRRRK